jgi:two-component system C4-dicarboxylate transport response regulator DctD
MKAAPFPAPTRARFGKFEHARGGTVFLDEIDSLPLPLQAKLLHVVQNREVTRLGSNEAMPLDVRFVAASKRDLGAAAAEGRFRADLLYRLNVVTIRMPGLGERREDIPLLFLGFWRRSPPHGPQTGAWRCPDDAGRIAARDWPGHVRELRNAAERWRLASRSADGRMRPTPTGTLSDRMAAHEKALIAAALAAHSGSLKATYEALGLSRKALYEKMQKHGLDRRITARTTEGGGKRAFSVREICRFFQKTCRFSAPAPGRMGGNGNITRPIWAGPTHFP